MDTKAHTRVVDASPDEAEGLLRELFRDDRLEFCPYSSITLVKPKSRNWCSWEDRGVPEARFPTLEEALLPGVVIVAAVERYSDTPHSCPLAYYDVQARQLHIGATPASLGIVPTDLDCFKKDGSGIDDRARVLLFGLEKDTLDDYFACRVWACGRVGVWACGGPDSLPCMEGVYRRLHNKSEQTKAERAHNFDVFVQIAGMRLRHTQYYEDGDCTSEMVEAEVQSLTAMEALWPEAVYDAYKKYWVYLALEVLDSESCDALISFHFERMVQHLSTAEVFELERCVSDGTKSKTLPFARELYPRVLQTVRWPSSARCVWLTSCIQLNLACKREEEEEDEEKRARQCTSFARKRYASASASSFLL